MILQSDTIRAYNLNYPRFKLPFLCRGIKIDSSAAEQHIFAKIATFRVITTEVTGGLT